MVEERPYDHLFKFLIIGDAGVGKSALLLRFADNTFTNSYINTIGVDFKIKTITIDGIRAKLQIWDTAGQERFRTITSTYYRGANGIILVYDVTRTDSYENVRKWLVEIAENDCENAPKLLVGNKIDMSRIVSTAEAEKFAKSKKLDYLEASAKENEGVHEIFYHLTKIALKKNSTSKEQKDGVDMNEKKKKKKCC